MKTSPSLFEQVTSKRSFAVGLLLTAALLFAVVAMTFDDDSKPLPGLNEKPETADQIVPVKKVEQLSSHLNKAPVLPFVNGSHPFFTMHLKSPAPTTPPVEPTPPPVLKKVALLYQGVYQTAEGSNQAFVKTETALLVLPLGGAVLNDWAVAEISPQKLTLTNRVSETTILEFNRETTLEVPEQ